MEITRTRQVFTLDELSPAARDKAVEAMCAEAWECLDSDMVSEYLAGQFAHWSDGNGCGVMSKRELKDKYRVRIYWSVGCLQSDNAQLDGVLSRDYHPNLAWPDGIHTIRVTTNTHSWSHATDVYELDDDGSEGRHTMNAKLIEAANDFVLELCQRLYRAARDECEHATSEEYVVLVEQERHGDRRRFDADGNIAPYEWWRDEVPA
jgi:hypothetical protein